MFEFFKIAIMNGNFFLAKSWTLFVRPNNQLNKQYSDCWLYVIIVEKRLQLYYSCMTSVFWKNMEKQFMLFIFHQVELLLSFCIHSGMNVCAQYSWMVAFWIFYHKSTDTSVDYKILPLKYLRCDQQIIRFVPEYLFSLYDKSIVG